MKILIINNKKYGGGAQSVFRENISLLKKDKNINVFEGSSDKDSDLTLKRYSKNILGYLFSIKNYKKTYQFLTENKIDIIHIHQYFGLSFGLLLAVKKYKKEQQQIIVCYTSHTYHLVCPNHSLYNSNEKVLCEKCIGKKIKIYPIFRKCCKNSYLFSVFRFIESIIQNNIIIINNLIDYYIVPSGFVKKKIVADGIDQDKITVLYNSLNDEFKKKQKIKNKENLICYYGRFNEEKNLIFMLDSLRKIFDKYKNYKLILVGQGPEEEKIIKHSKEIGIFNKIIFKKFIPQNELKEILNRVKITLMPSKVYETFGLTILESIVYECIPITIDKGALNELQKRMDCGRVYKYQNKDDFVEKIKDVIENYNFEIERVKKSKDTMFLKKEDNIMDFYNKLKKVYK